MDKTDSPVFIIASERSGTNLLRKRITESQKHYLGPSPAHFLKHLYYQEPYYGDLKNDKNFINFIEQAIDLCTVHFSPWKINWTASSLLSDYQSKERNAIQLMHFMMTKYAKEQGYESYICKDNFLYEFALDIANEIPGALFIYLYRDPRDFVLSQIKRPGVSKSVVRFSRLWGYEQTRSIAVAKKLEGKKRCISVSYENFISDEVGELDRLLAFLNTPLSTGETAYVDEINASVHEWANLDKPTDKNNAGKYLDELSPKQIRIIESFCSYQMKKLGYVEAFNKTKISRFYLLLDYVLGYFRARFDRHPQNNIDIVKSRHSVMQKVRVNYRSDI